MSLSSSEETKLTVISTLKKLRRPCTTLDLASALGMKRSEVNPFLYDLQKQGLIRKVQESHPPMWDLTAEGSMYGVRKSARNPIHGRGHGILSHGSQSMGLQAAQPIEKAAGLDDHTLSFRSASRSPVKTNRSNLQLQLLQVLGKATKPHTALEIAHKVGLRTRKEVNPDLYAMEKEGVVTMKQSAGPPLWELVRGNSRMPETGHVSDPPQEDGVERMEVQSYSSSAVDLSQIPEGDLRERLLAVMQASPDLSRTELELCRTIGTTASRSEVKAVLDSLLSEGVVQKTWSIPTKWSITKSATLIPNSTPSVSSIASPAGMQISPREMSFLPPPPRATNTPLLATNAPSLALKAPPSFSSTAVSDMNKNPVSALLEYCQANKRELTFIDVREYGPPHMKHFVVAAQVGSTRYSEVESTSKKDAKRKAADLALQVIQQDQAQRQVQFASVPASRVLSTTPGASNTTFSDKIAELSHRWYMQVQSSIELPQPGRKVIAAFVMEDVSSGEMKVVSVGSGTRCITGDHMSLEGLVVNDSHAEVIARRSLMRFFYKQLFTYYQGSVNTIFCQGDSELLQVKSNVRFHLYISTAPCGDGAQFSRGDDQNRDPPSDDQHVPTIQGKLQGLLRTKMEGGEGTIPIGPDAVPLTWDGIQQGARLRTMSCSDKVGRWNVLGLQGSLLSLFISPVYMSSLTLGSLHHHGHLSRAVCCRFADIGDSLPAGFAVNHPSLGRVQGGDEMRRHTEKTSNLSVNWAFGDERGELVDGGNGYPVPPPGLHRMQTLMVPARVAKIRLYAEFVKLASLCNRSELVSAKSYKETKELASAFQEAKQLLYWHCERKGYGSWMRKPLEEEQFGMDSLNVQ